MKKFLLIGPSQGGKSTIMYSYKGKEAPNTATIETDTIKKGLFGLGDNLIEIGGNDTNIQDTIEKLNNLKDTTVIFVFDGSQFIKQVCSQSDGGEIYARWLHYSKNAKIVRPHFVATHADLEPNMDAMIQGLVSNANRHYNDILDGSGIERYQSVLFKPPFFHCVNAKDKEQVKAMFKAIKQ